MKIIGWLNKKLEQMKAAFKEGFEAGMAKTEKYRISATTSATEKVQKRKWRQ